MITMEVEAIQDVKVGKNFTVARKGDHGEAFKNIQPFDNSNVGKVLVKFGEKSRCYWVQPQDLKALGKPGEWVCYIAKPVVKKLFPDAVKIPANVAVMDYNFGENLKKIRQARHLSQSGLSKAMTQVGLKTSQAAICFREQKKNSPNGKFLNVAAKALNVPTWVFFLDLSNCDGFSLARKYLMSLSSSVCEG